MKHTKRALAILLALVMALGLLPFSAFAATTITKVEITGFVVPKEGDYGAANLAGIAIPENAPYTLDNCFWFNRDTRKAMTSSETFTDGTTYFVTFKITPKAGYEFSQNVIVTINGSTDLCSSRLLGDTSTDTMTAYSAFFNEFEKEPEPIAAVDVVNFKAPVIGQTAGENLENLTVPEGACYSVKYKAWYDPTKASTMGTDDVFVNGVSYYARIVLTPGDGYYFDPMELDSICLNGSSEQVSESYNMDHGDYIMYSIDFEPAAAHEGEAITSVDVSGYAAPVIGQSLAGHMHELTVSDNAPYEIADVAWYWPGSEEPMNDYNCFETNSPLILAFTFAPKEGYYFDNDSLPWVTVNGSDDLADELIGLGTGFYVDTQGLFHFETVEITPAAGELIPITEIIVNGYADPVAGETVAENIAKLSVPEGANYFISEVKWCFAETTTDLGADYEFQAGTSYYLGINIRPTGKAYYDEDSYWSAPGFTVKDPEYFGAGLYLGGAPVTVAEAEYDIVSQVTVEGIQRPVAGQKVEDNLRSLTVPLGAPYFISSMFWTLDGQELGTDYTFVDGETYVLHITVDMNNGYAYDAVDGEIPELLDTEENSVTIGENWMLNSAFQVYIPTEEMKATGSASGDVLWGDANGDGAISNKDVVRLKNYLANYDESTGLSNVELAAGADANGDGAISNKDVVRLKNYLANFDESTGISSNGTTTYVLGP